MWQLNTLANVLMCQSSSNAVVTHFFFACTRGWAGGGATKRILTCDACVYNDDLLYTHRLCARLYSRAQNLRAEESCGVIHTLQCTSTTRALQKRKRCNLRHYATLHGYKFIRQSPNIVVYVCVCLLFCDLGLTCLLWGWRRWLELAFLEGN